MARVAIVGAGAMGRRHAAAARRVGAEVVAVVDTDRRTAEQLDAPVHTDLESAFGAGPIDVVHVCTPADSHAEIAREALDLGAHVIVEKPLAPDGATTDELLRRAETAGRFLVPTHQFLFQDGVRRVVDGIGRLGDVVHVEFAAATAGAGLTTLTANEVVDEILPHPLSLFERLLPGAIAGSWDAQRPADGELRAGVAHDDTTLSILVSTRARPTRNELVVAGTAATAHVDLYHGFASIERGGDSRRRKVVRPFTHAGGTLGQAGVNLARRAARRETAYPGLRSLIEETYDAVAGGTPSPVTPREVLAVAEARDSILRATSR